MHPTMLAFDAVLPDAPVALDLTHVSARLQFLTDQRDPRGVCYPLSLLLMIALLAKLTGHTQVRAIAEWAA